MLTYNNNTVDNNIYDPKWSNIILFITPYCLFTGLISAYYGYWDTAISEVAVFTTSFLHWRNPQPGWYIVRILDITVVHISGAIHISAIWHSSSSEAFLLMVISIICFMFSMINNSYKHHISGWIFACTSNLLLTHKRTMITF